MPSAITAVVTDLRRYLPPSPLSLGFIDAQPSLVHTTRAQCVVGSPSLIIANDARSGASPMSPPLRRQPHRDHPSTPVDTLRLVADIRWRPSPTPPMPAPAGRRPPTIAEPYTLDPCSVPRLAPRYPPYTLYRHGQ
ncbi:hypothetical protein AURDEDRAFT_172889 [Auricularia subglabra TFB-10046 SS5]|nr:hypothetical protein AURDEDRAFT_172889 [Auricularia subglabra TFB-10046 SS5]